MNPLPKSFRFKGGHPVFAAGELEDWVLSAELRGVAGDDRRGLRELFSAPPFALQERPHGFVLHFPARLALETLQGRGGLPEGAAELREFLDWFLSGPPLHWRLRSRRLNLAGRTFLMGVVNVTPDSFSDGGRFLEPEKAVEHGCRLVEAGADFLDIGGESTRPGAAPVSAAEERARVVPVIQRLREQVAVPISVDTYKAEVARAALEAGAEIVNDISGFRFDPEMASVVARHGAGAVLMHIRGTPRNMQKNPRYGDVMEAILVSLARSIARAVAGGCAVDQLVVDPGIGFGKRWFDNYDILNRLPELAVLRRPVMVGASRKSFLGKVLGVLPQERLIGTVAAHTWAILQGAQIVRVHDVAEARQAAQIADVLVCRRRGTAPEELEERFHG